MATSIAAITGYGLIAPAPVGSEPAITDVAPDSGSAGTQVVLTGTNFGAIEGSATVGGVAAIIDAWADTEITMTTSETLSVAEQDIIVTISGGSKAYAPNGFNCTAKLTASAISPDTYAPAGGGTAVITYANKVTDISTVTIIGVSATIVSQTTTTVTVTIPAGTGTGDVVITTSGGATSTLGGAFSYTGTGVTAITGPDSKAESAMEIASSQNFGEFDITSGVILLWRNDTATVTFAGDNIALTDWDTSGTWTLSYATGVTKDGALVISGTGVGIFDVRVFGDDTVNDTEILTYYYNNVINRNANDVCPRW